MNGTGLLGLPWCWWWWWFSIYLNRFLKIVGWSIHFTWRGCCYLHHHSPLAWISKICSYSISSSLLQAWHQTSNFVSGEAQGSIQVRKILFGKYYETIITITQIFRSVKLSVFVWIFYSHVWGNVISCHFVLHFSIFQISILLLTACELNSVRLPMKLLLFYVYLVILNDKFYWLLSFVCISVWSPGLIKARERNWVWLNRHMTIPMRLYQESRGICLHRELSKRYGVTLLECWNAKLQTDLFSFYRVIIFKSFVIITYLPHYSMFFPRGCNPWCKPIV